MPTEIDQSIDPRLSYSGAINNRVHQIKTFMQGVLHNHADYGLKIKDNYKTENTYT